MTFPKRAARYLAALFFLFFLFASQSSAVPNARPRDFSNAKVEWKALENAPFIQIADYKEIQLTIHCAKIDLTAPGLTLQMLRKRLAMLRTFAKKTDPFWPLTQLPFT